MENKENKRIDTFQMARIAIVTALFCVLAPISIPLPFSPVPITLGNFVVFLCVFVLKTQYALISYIIYLLLGLIGLPVFSGFSGGVAKIMGPTGGYLVGFLVIILITGILMQKAPKKSWYLYYLIGIIVGEAIMYVLGTAWLARSLSVSFVEGLGMGVIPYLPGDAVKLIIAMKVGSSVRNALTKSTGKDPLE